MEDAVELYEYKYSEISAELFHSRPTFIAILPADDPSIHPIIADYDGWMALVILCTYLRRSSRDDLQIYFLAHHFTPMELRNLSVDDPFAAAKKGVMIRHLTVPEIVLQTPENDHEGMPMPFQWCKMRNVLRKTAAACIPAGFMPAKAYLDGIVSSLPQRRSLLVLSQRQGIPRPISFPNQIVSLPDKSDAPPAPQYLLLPSRSPLPNKAAAPCRPAPYAVSSVQPWQDPFPIYPTSAPPRLAAPTFVLLPLLRPPCPNPPAWQPCRSLRLKLTCPVLHPSHPALCPASISSIPAPTCPVFAPLPTLPAASAKLSHRSRDMPGSCFPPTPALIHPAYDRLTAAFHFAPHQEKMATWGYRAAPHYVVAPFFPDATRRVFAHASHQRRRPQRASAQQLDSTHAIANAAPLPSASTLPAAPRRSHPILIPRSSEPPHLVLPGLG
ncbi:hypothetical protein B0H13DRAFT_2352064 [Mycena leptocephala]|nr:hypothetical protein B0H13DRAFT_2352064 [Mycena leptocephala]